jgi:hypothetical protein
VILFTHTITPRLQCISDFIGKEIVGEIFQLTTDINIFLQYPGPKINYSKERITENEFWLKPHSLLFEKGIKQQTIECSIVNDNKAFFKTSGDFPFDIFAATFYLLSRYEEYLPHQKDMYGRYAHENSLAYKENFLQLPLINFWLNDFKKALKQKSPSLTTHDSRFTFLPTYDIDEAFSYKHKTWRRALGGLAKDALKGQWSKISERIQALQNKKKDPYDSFDWMDELHQKYNLKPLYFFLVAPKNFEYDKNILPSEKAMQELIKKHISRYTIGIHPSWQCGNKLSLISSEIRSLENITGNKITISRRHYLKFTLPQTFRAMIGAGITEEHSMSYASINGFRASVASKFYWYDLEREETTGLLLYPFCQMDANSFYEQKLTAQQALEEMRQYYTILKSVGGMMITLWHNNFFGTDKVFAGWKESYEQFIKEIS